MKKIISYFLLLSLLFLGGCIKDDTYPGGTIGSYIALLDLRSLDKGSELTLTTENMFGSNKITGLVVSDHSGGNMPQGLLVVQDRRRLGLTRGISILIGEEAKNYVPGDSVIINVEGGKLNRVNGILQLTGISNANITKVSSGNKVTPLVVKASQVLAAPGSYEGTLVSVTKAGFDPSYATGSTYTGDRIINDGFGNIALYTEAGAQYASSKLPFLSNFTGIVFGSSDNKLQLRPRSSADITVLSADAPKIAPLIITGFLVDHSGVDSSYEYIQLKATKDIDFAATSFSVVTTNNAGASTPTGYPANGWATGDLRTYKINLTAGTVKKGEYFYVGANKNIWGSGTTDISTSKWFSKMYTTENGDGFGTKTNNLLANSGNGAGIAVFDNINVDAATIPVDVIFYGGNGSLYTAGPPAKGYRITNTDYYDITNPTTLEDQPFYTMGSNTGKFAFPTATSFAQLGGTYNKKSGRWTKARALQNITLTKTSTVSEIEGATTIEE